MPAEAVDRHLAGCPGCRSYQARAQLLHRSMTLRPAPAVPDLTTVILDRTPAPPAERWALRIALGVVAIAQLTLAVSQLLGAGHAGHAGGLQLGHLDHESAAWNLAVGVGLLWAALRPRAAVGQLPVLAGFVAVLTVLSTGDLINQAVSVGRVLSHGLVVLGLLLLFLVHRQYRGHHPLPAGYGDSSGTGDTSASTTDDDHALDSGGRGPRRVHRFHRPASKHRAA